MKILYHKTCNGFYDERIKEQPKLDAEFLGSLKSHEGKHVSFRGVGEKGQFRKGYLREVKGDTVTFWNGIADVMSSEIFVYPIREVMIAVDEQ